MKQVLLSVWLILSYHNVHLLDTKFQKETNPLRASNPNLINIALDKRSNKRSSRALQSVHYSSDRRRTDWVSKSTLRIYFSSATQINFWSVENTLKIYVFCIVYWDFFILAASELNTKDTLWQIPFLELLIFSLNGPELVHNGVI